MYRIFLLLLTIFICSLLVIFPPNKTNQTGGEYINDLPSGSLFTRRQNLGEIDNT